MRELFWKIKKFVMVLVIALIVSSLSACGNDEKGQAGDKSSGEKITLNVWQLKPEIADTLPEVFKTYTDKNPNVEIVVDRPGGNDFDTTIKAQMASGVYPDLCMVNSYSILQSFAKGGNAAAITEQDFTKEFNQKILPSISYEGEIYGVPCEMDGVGILYNRRIFEELGLEIPKTLSEMRTVCEKIKQSGITPFAVGVKDSWTMNHTFSMLHSELTDAQDFTEKMNKGEASFQDKSIDAAFDFINLMIENCNDKPSDSDYSNMCTLFAKEECAMMACGMWGMTSVLMVNPDIEVGVFAIPVNDNPEDAKLCVDNAAVFFMPPQSEHQEETLKLMKWISSPEFAELYAEKCGIYMPTKNASLPTQAEEAWKDIKAYIDDECMTSIPFLYYPAGFDAGAALQNYFSGTWSEKEVRSAWDEMWKDLVQP